MLSQAYEPEALGLIENGSLYFRQWHGPAVLLPHQRAKLTKGATTTSTPCRSWVRGRHRVLSAPCLLYPLKADILSAGLDVGLGATFRNAQAS